MSRSVNRPRDPAVTTLPSTLTTALHPHHTALQRPRPPLTSHERIEPNLVAVTP